MKVAVIGAGIVGLSTANWLKRYGQDVTLFDREDPGSQASFGNAGTYAKYANIPTNSSSFFYLFPYLLLNKNSPLFFKRGKFIQSLPWLMQYLSNCIDFILSFSFLLLALSRVLRLYRFFR